LPPEVGIKPLTGENLKAAIHSASKVDLVSKNGIMALELTASGDVISPGTISRFADNGDIVGN
jgi:hypothetical protein